MIDMNEENEFFTITIEECAELQMAMTKIMRFGHTQKGMENLKQELGDVACMLALALHYEYITDEELQECVNKKAEKLKEWSCLRIPDFME